MNRRKACLLIAATPAAAGLPATGPDREERPWIGPEFWSNPLQDWRLRNGRIECFVAGGDRNVFLLTHEVSDQTGTLSMRVKLGRLEEDTAPLQAGFAGFRLGIRGHFDDYRDGALYGVGLNAGLASDGRLFIGKLETGAAKANGPLQNLELVLEATASGAACKIRLSLLQADGKPLAETAREVPARWMSGGVALVCSSGPVENSPDQASAVVTMSGINKRGSERRGNVRFWFQNWTVTGSAVRVREERAYGPILFAMHTVSRGVMKMTAQMAPVGKSPEPVRLQIRRGAQGPWRTIATSTIDPLSRTAAFRIPKWQAGADTPYRVAYKMTRDYYFEGTIRKDPVDKPKIVVAGLSCNNDFGFPHADVARSVRHFQPDVALFVGDQIYERCAGYGIQRLPLETAALDYLRKWYLFGWEFRDILRDTPSVCMPDDHDVYHGNVWGAGGRHAEGTGVAAQDSGGYVEPAAWVNMMQRTQTGHLPDPFDPAPVEQGIQVYYTEMLRGGVSFAIVEDRKWKSSPKQMIPKGNIVNGWALNPEYNAARDGDVAGAQLLGDRQQKFLEHWAADWSGGVRFKAVVTQTLFANLATLPPPANDDSITGKLPIQKPGGYAEGEVHTADHDSNGWPQTQRNRALRSFRRCFAVHITGDQHLGSTIQYGIDAWNDGAFALCTPAVSNLFPRRWYPAEPGADPLPHSPRNTGRFLDGFGNKMTVHSVFNPRQMDPEPNPLMDRSPGFGVIEFDRGSGQIKLAVWPRREDASRDGASPAEGWPIAIEQSDNGYPHAGPALEPIQAPRAGLCLQVIREESSEIVYTLRLRGTSFTPRVYEMGVYTVRVFDPDGAYQELRKGLKARQS